MKLGTVIGRVTFSRTLKPLEGGRYLIVSPFSREQFAAGLDAPRSMGKDPSLVVYDDLGGAHNGLHHRVIGESAREHLTRGFKVAAKPSKVVQRACPLGVPH